MKRVGEPEALAPLRVGQQILDGGAHGRVRQFGLPAGDLHHRPHAADVGDADEQRGLRLHAAEQPHGVRLVLRRRDRAHRFVEGFVETVVRIGFEQRDKPLRLLTGEVPEIGRPFGQGRKESTHGRMVGQQPPERVAGSEPDNSSSHSATRACASSAAKSCGAVTIRCASELAMLV